MPMDRGKTNASKGPQDMSSEQGGADGLDPRARELINRGLSRRRFLTYGTGAVGAGLLSACVSNPIIMSDNGQVRGDSKLIKDRETRSFNPIPAENRKPGTKAWELEGNVDGRIQGFADKISLKQGEKTTIYVESPVAWKAEIYRIGWYGGLGGRLITTIGEQKPRNQSAAKFTKHEIENMVECHWKPSVDIQTDKKWTTGFYLVKLITNDGSMSYIPIVVRDDRPSTYVQQASVTTWLAYNTYGRRSIYAYLDAKHSTAAFKGRSRLVSFDRPFSMEERELLNGAERFLEFEIQMVRFMEARGYDVTYATNLDTHTSAETLAQHDTFISVGHDEYWTKEMRDNLEILRDSGVNLCFFGANDGYRAVRLEDSPLGPLRRMRHYKEYTEDPLLGKDDPRVAAQWRFGPTNRPENELLGIMYAADPVDFAWVAGDTDHWLYKKSGFKPGEKVPHMVGHEYDKVWTEGPFANYTPGNINVLATSPVVTSEGDKDVAHTTYYTAQSGAGVFAAGTIRWSWGLDDYGTGTNITTHFHNPGVKSEKVQRFTENLLEVFSKGEAGNYLEIKGLA